jgi:hypothetical protein
MKSFFAEGNSGYNIYGKERCLEEQAMQCMKRNIIWFGHRDIESGY